MRRLQDLTASGLLVAFLSACGPAAGQDNPLSGRLLDYEPAAVAEITDARAETGDMRTIRLLTMGTPTMAQAITYSVDCRRQAYRQTSARSYFDGLPSSEELLADPVEFVRGPHWSMLAEVCRDWDQALEAPDFTTVEQFKGLALARNPHRPGPPPTVVPRPR